MKIRPFEATEAEYAAVEACHNAVWPDGLTTTEELSRADRLRSPSRYWHRIVAERYGRVVAHAVYCEAWWFATPDQYYAEIAVHPEHRRHGIGAALHDHIIEALAPRDPAVLATYTRENQPEGIRFLDARKYVVEMREPISVLDVHAFDPGPYAGLHDRMRDLGVRILTLADIEASGQDWRPSIWQLDWELHQDVPTTDTLKQAPFEEWLKRFESPNHLPDAWFIALVGERYVGMSTLSATQADLEKLYVGFTGVTRDMRRKGVATALKLRTIAFAREYGATTIQTDNAEHNPMYQLNLRLGFEPVPAYLAYKKVLRQS